MKTQVDWLAWTVLLPSRAGQQSFHRFESIAETIEQNVGTQIGTILAQAEWTEGKGRAPYAHRWQAKEIGMSVFWSGRVDNALIEVSGQGMEYFRVVSLEAALFQAASERVTRLDIASDIETDLSPTDFLAAGYAERIKSRGSAISATGETQYVGSRQSERFARVYRYAPPSPRSHLLRVEHELKKEAARAVISYILAYGVEWAQESIGKTFDWKHEAWRPGDQSAFKIAAPREDRTLSKTELWLRLQAAPAFKKLVQQGIVTDPEAWLREVFLSELDNDVQGVLL